VRAIFRRFPVVAVIVIAGLAVGTAFYFYDQYQILSGGEAKAIAAKIGSFYEVPQETPTVATVTDKSKLGTDQFFSGAENGDKILIFASAGKAILYRPSSGKIVMVAPVSQASSPAGTSK
jgi:hypothetical protein